MIAEDADGRDAQRGGDLLRQDLRFLDRAVVGEIAAEQQHVRFFRRLCEQRLHAPCDVFLTWMSATAAMRRVSVPSTSLRRPRSPPSTARSLAVHRLVHETRVLVAPFVDEGWRVRKDGTRFWATSCSTRSATRTASCSALPRSPATSPTSSEREQALFESEQRFRMLVQGVRDYAIYMLDADGHRHQLERRRRAHQGLYARTRSSASISRASTPRRTAPRGEPAAGARDRAARRTYEREGWRVRKDGSLFWASVVIDPIYDEHGEHIGFAKVTRDITEKKQAQEELEERATRSPSRRSCRRWAS